MTKKHFCSILRGSSGEYLASGGSLDFKTYRPSLEIVGKSISSLFEQFSLKNFRNDKETIRQRFLGFGL